MEVETRNPRRAALVVIGAGIAAALHVGKLAPAIAELQRTLGLSLVQAGFLLSLVQGAGMLAGAGFGLVADGLGARRSIVSGLLVLTFASAAGAFADGAAALMALRALEGFGFLLVVLAAPGLVRRLVPPAELPSMMGWWSTYMPLATAAALLAGPWVIGALGWRGWWLALAAVVALAALAVLLRVPALSVPPAAGWAQRLRRTLKAAGPWWLALSFGLYSSQWLAVIGFLPTIYAAAGIGGALIGVLTALAAGVNALGNVAGGALLQRRVAAPRLLVIGFTTMALAAAATFGAETLPAGVRYAAVLVFSAVGGMVPATLFALAVHAAPGDDALATTVGWMQQGSAFGQFCGPPIVAALAAHVGGWQRTWLFNAACSLLGLVLAAAIAALLEKKRYATIPR
jgi:MFS transporter, CP family, cyanate transporter